MNLTPASSSDLPSEEGLMRDSVSGTRLMQTAIFTDDSPQNPSQGEFHDDKLQAVAGCKRPKRNPATCIWQPLGTCRPATSPAACTLSLTTVLKDSSKGIDPNRGAHEQRHHAQSFDRPAGAPLPDRDLVPITQAELIEREVGGQRLTLGGILPD